MDVYINRTNGINNPVGTNESAASFTEQDWTIGLGPFADKLMPDGPIGSHLEINSHGERGQILLLPPVKMENVSTFATLVRRLIVPGGFIEILACLAGSMPFGSLLAALEKAALAENGQSQSTDSFAVSGTGFTLAELKLARSELAAISRKIGRMSQSSPDQLAAEMAIIRRETKRNMQAIVELMQLAIRSGLTFIPDPAFPTKQTDDDRNGPLFCSTLARLTQCKVRAAILVQTEEGEGFGFESFGYRFGNWEGDVFDFTPDGQVRHVGLNLPRPVFRTHDGHGDGPLRVV